jgi:hypothetical protein
MDRRDIPADDQPERPAAPGSRQELRSRLSRLPPGHPSAADEDPITGSGGRDAPRRAEQPERQPPWYSEHEAREQDVEDQRREHSPGADPARWREDWHRQRHGDVPAAFRPDVADRLPAVSRGARGRLDRHDGGDGLPLDSGSKTGLAEALERRLGRLPGGFTSLNKTHVEAHAAAWLWLHRDVREATLYVNKRPCPGPRGCRERLDAMLPPAVRLTLYAPGGFWRVYHGRDTEGGS